MTHGRFSPLVDGVSSIAVLETVVESAERARERESESESESAREREQERDHGPPFTSFQVIAKLMSFLIMTFHAVSATITSQSCPFCHFCHFIWSADDRDIVLFME